MGQAPPQRAKQVPCRSYRHHREPLIGWSITLRFLLPLRQIRIMWARRTVWHCLVM